MTETRNDKIIDSEKEKEQLDFEAQQNIAGFFGLLLEIDKRLNPQLYQAPAPSQELTENQYENNRSPDNTN